MTDSNQMPTPKFSIGDVVYIVFNKSIEAQYSCPDCLDTKQWKVITPAGTELTASCQRCNCSYSSLTQKLPSLKYQKKMADIKKLTIGMVKIQWPVMNDGWQDESVNYMCLETGIGGGNVYKESVMFSSKEEAEAEAQEEADIENSKNSLFPETLEKINIGSLNIRDALIETANSAIINGSYAFRSLRNKICDAVNIDCKNEDKIQEIEKILNDTESKALIIYHKPRLDILLSICRRVIDSRGQEESIKELEKFFLSLGELGMFYKEEIKEKGLDIPF